MGPQKSRELYRVSFVGSNPLEVQGQALAAANYGVPLGHSASQTDLRYHGEFL